MMKEYIDSIRHAPREDLLHEIGKKMILVSVLQADVANLRAIAAPLLALRPVDPDTRAPVPDRRAGFTSALQVFLQNYLGAADADRTKAQLALRESQLWNIHIAINGPKTRREDRPVDAESLITAARAQRYEAWAYKQRLSAVLDVLALYRYYVVLAAQQGPIHNEAQADLAMLDDLTSIWRQDFNNAETKAQAGAAHG